MRILKSILLHPIATAFLVSIVLIPGTLSAGILTVKQDGTGDFTEIQEAYLAASSGDTVLVFPGIYLENLYFNRNIELTLASLFLIAQDRSYITNTIIDGNQTGGCLYIDGVDENELTVAGFTITNGSGSTSVAVGGGVHLRDSKNVRLKSNIIRNNIATAGAGIYLMFSKVYLFDNTIKHNRAYGSGGGIYNRYESEVYFDETHKNNVYLNYGTFGADISKLSYSGPMNIILDTCTVQIPDYHFILSYNEFNLPNNDITISVDQGKIQPVYKDLYVDPATGNDDNDGLTPETALKTVAWACKLIASDSTNPLNIYLMDGIYSPSTNQEGFPFNVRSHISLIGESKENTIFDADSLYFFINGSGFLKNFILKNISFRNCFSNNLESVITGCMYFYPCENIKLENLDIWNCHNSGTSGIGFDYPDKLMLKNINFSMLKGGRVCRMGNSLDPGKTFKFENITIRNFFPDEYPIQTGGEGGGMVITGNLYEDNRFSGSLINLQITDGLRIPDPGWPPGSNVAVGITRRAKVNIVNSTIGNNVCRSEFGFAGVIDEGALVNFYNTIMYGDSLKELALGSYYGSYFAATANISYSNIEGGLWNIWRWDPMHTVNWFEGNIDQNPQWVGTGDTAYYLQDDSPCINAGTPMYEDGMEPPYIREEDGKYVLYMHNMDTVHLPATDLAGNPRISGGRIDMGAYEYQDTTTAIAEHAEIPENTVDVVVYPNPFYVHSFVDFSLDEKSHIQIIITDLNGKIVNNFLDATLPKGNYKFTWKGDNNYGTTLKTGVYILNLWKNGEKASTVKVVKERY